MNDVSKLIDRTISSVDFDSDLRTIGKHAFYNCDNLTSVTVPSTITKIDDSAFQNCHYLTTVTLPNTLSDMGQTVFTSCSRLTTVNIPSALTEIPVGMFNSCSSLSSITIPNGVTSIKQTAFNACTSLTNITIPNSVTTIGDSAFSSSGLTSLSIPSSVTSISGHIVYNCGNLTTIVVDQNNSYYDSRNNCNAIIETSTNELIEGCNSSTIPNTVTSIGEQAFYGIQFTSMTIPSSVTTIKTDAFSSTGLTTITIPNSVTTIGNNAFNGCGSLASVILSDNLTEIPMGLFFDCASLTSITIPEGVETIGDSAFSGTGLTSLTIPSSVTTIGYGIVDNCSSITEVTIESTYPPVIQGGDPFGYNEGATYPIYVPSGSLSYYENDQDWQQYTGRLQVAGGGGTQKFVKVSSTNDVTSGTYLIVNEYNSPIALNASLAPSTSSSSTGLNSSSNYMQVTVTQDQQTGDYEIAADSTTLGIAVDYDASTGYLTWTDGNNTTAYIYPTTSTSSTFNATPAAPTGTNKVGLMYPYSYGSSISFANTQYTSSSYRKYIGYGSYHFICQRTSTTSNMSGMSLYKLVTV